MIKRPPYVKFLILTVMCVCSLANAASVPAITLPDARVEVHSATKPQSVKAVTNKPRTVSPVSERTLVGKVIKRGNSRWTAVPWSSVTGFASDDLQHFFSAWEASCQAPKTAVKTWCDELPAVATFPLEQQRQWLQEHLQPYRVSSLSGRDTGTLTSYYEPVLEGSRAPTSEFATPLYSLPDNIGDRAWFSRKQIETNIKAQQHLAGRELLYLANPIDALILHIQGSGTVRVRELDGSIKHTRMAYAGTNNRRYRSVPSALLKGNHVSAASWEEIQSWALKQDGKSVKKMLWHNPRYVFFKEEEPLNDGREQGPKGAQGVPLTARRSIAVDPKSIPYGTPVWISSMSQHATIQRLVMAQDTGNAIRGAVRADFFAGTGDAAGDFAGAIKQPLQAWVLWPRK